MDFHWNLSDSKSSHVSETLLNILIDHNNAVVWMVYTCPLISVFQSFYKSLEIVANTSTSISITVTILFHRFFSSLIKSTYLSPFLLLFTFTLLSAKTARSTNRQVLYIDVQPGQRYHSNVIHRKEVTHSDGSYGKKSRRRAWLTI